MWATTLSSAALGLVAALVLHFVYRLIQSNWPTSYYALSDYWSYVKALLPSRYLLFRFGPVVLISLFGAHQMRTAGWPVWPFVATTAAIHAGTTSLRAAWRVVRYRQDGDRNAPLVMLHLVSAAAIAVTCVAAALLTATDLAVLVPDYDSIKNELWAAALASVLTFAFFRAIQAPQRTLAELIKSQRQRISPQLFEYARAMADHWGLDYHAVETVILTESIQRPKWYRLGERIKGLVFRKGTYGIMQVQSPRPLNDRQSIDLALREHRDAFMYPEAYAAKVGQSHSLARERLSNFNSSPQFLDLATDIYYEIG